MLVPKLVTSLRGYTRRQFGSDLAAGVIVGVVALPLAIAFAIASGVTPERGLYTAIVAGFIISALGGSRVQIGGPTGAFVVIVYGIVQQYGVDGLTIATLMAGVMLIVFGLARMGAVLRYIPHPLIIGFTSGIAIIIFTSQVKDFLGLRMSAVPADFFEKWSAFAAHAGSVNPWALGVAAFSLAILILWPRLELRVPGPFVALIVTTAVVQIFHLPVETIATRFGGIPSSLPLPTIPHVTFAELRALISPAFTIALLGAIESLLSAVVADGMIGGRHRPNMELVAQGVANIVSPLMGGIPATGAIARTATNVKNGGRTPVAGITHAVTLLLITLFLGRWAGLIPLATLAAILVIVAYHMSEWRSFRAELRAPKSDVAVLLTTFLLTVIVDLTVAIEVGMVLAVFLFMHRMSEVTNIKTITRGLADDPTETRYTGPGAVSRKTIPRGVVVYEIDGPFFFGAAETFKEAMGQIAGRPKALIIRMRDVNALDSTGMRALRELVRRSRGDRTLVLLSELHAQPLLAIERSGMIEEIGADQIYLTVDDALERAAAHVAMNTTGATPVSATPIGVAAQPPRADEASRPDRRDGDES